MTPRINELGRFDIWEVLSFVNSLFILCAVVVKSFNQRNGNSKIN